MRELMGRLPTNDPNVTKNIYRSETIRCQKCQTTVPTGIEVVTLKIEGDFKKVLKHEYYCRADAFDSHGLDYETKLQNRPVRPRTNA
jgi:hypothetical protein